MRTILVYQYQIEHYVVLLGESCVFKRKEEIFRTGREKEIFSVSIGPNMPFLDLLRSMVAEADRRQIKDIKGLEKLLGGTSGKSLGKN